MKRQQIFNWLMLRPPRMLVFLLLFVLFSCQKKGTEILPVQESVLKSIESIFEFPKESSIKETSLIQSFDYSNGKFSKASYKTTTILTDGTSEIYFGSANLQYPSVDEYKLVSETMVDSKTISNEITAKKANGGFEITQQDLLDSNSYSVLTVEENANKQATKIIIVKTVTTGANGVKKETPNGYGQRWEYDIKGNATKVYYTNGATKKEYLRLEHTFDDNPNPFKPFTWLYRLGGTASENNNNILKTKVFDIDGKLIGEQITVYTYDTNKYPLTSTQTGISYETDLKYGKTTTTYKY